MGKRSTFHGYLRQRGAPNPASSSSAPSVGVIPSVLRIAGVSALLASAGILTGKFLPKGAIPLSVDIVGEGTGGTDPLLDVGLELGTPQDAGLVDGAVVDGNSRVVLGSATAGALLGTVLTETAEVTVSDGGGTNATGGTFDLLITYTFDDDGVINN